MVRRTRIQINPTQESVSRSEQSSARPARKATDVQQTVAGKPAAPHMSAAHASIGQAMDALIEGLCAENWGASPAQLGTCTGPVAALALDALTRRLAHPQLVLVPGPQVREALAMDLAALAPTLHVLHAPAEDSASDENKGRVIGEWMPFLGALSALDANAPALILASLPSLLVPLPDEKKVAASTIALKRGLKLAPEKLLTRLEAASYEHTVDVERPGQYARRGGIVDVWPHALAHPLRLDYFGDDMDAIRSFDPATQRSTAEHQTIAFPLLAIATDDTDADTGLLNYLPRSAMPVMPERRETLLRLESLRPFHTGRRRARLDALTEWMNATPRVELTAAPIAPRTGARNLDVRPFTVPAGGAEAASHAVKELLSGGQAVAIYAGSEGEAHRLKEALEANAVTGPTIAVEAAEISGSFVWAAARASLLSGADLLGKHRLRHGVNKGELASPDALHRAIDDFVKLAPLDFIVHSEQGIGRYLGTEILRTPDGAQGEYLRIEFDGGTHIHVPVTSADLVQKYIGSRGIAPRLSTYNSSAWSERKGRVREAVMRLAAEMLRLQALRGSESGFAFPAADAMLHDFVESFPFRDTPDQERVWSEMQRDMEASRPMDRLLCGDVGFGKTELAMRAAMKAALAGKQTAVLVPTTVLAQQHYLTFTSRMAGYPVLVDSLSRFKTAREQSRVIERLGDGSLDIVIGTHRLLSKDVSFKDLGLVIIDEEQRFGVEHKERLKQLRATVDVLTMTATPIPRTLHMSMIGIRDISSLTTPPEHRLPVETRICRFDPNLVREAILRELARDGQVYFVHNRVLDIKNVVDRMRALVPEARVVCGHGQMNEHELEEVMLTFINHEADVLVCTTIIESGIDVQSANTMFIDEAHRYGLADLHQLRGRVGRYRHQATCHLILPDDTALRADAEKRLRAITTYAHLGSGFSIAMQDLEIRGAGNILGIEQSGHIASIGYDLYCRMLEQAVKQLRGEAAPSEVECALDLDLDLVLPKDYVVNPEQRVQVYRLIARCATPTQADSINADLRDRFGRPPAAVERLLMTAVVRRRLGRLGVTSLTVGRGAAKDAPAYFQLKAVSARAAVQRLVKGQAKFRLVDDSTIALPLHKNLGGGEEQLRYLHGLLEMLAVRGIVPDGLAAADSTE